MNLIQYPQVGGIKNTENLADVIYIWSLVVTLLANDVRVGALVDPALPHAHAHRALQLAEQPLHRRCLVLYAVCVVNLLWWSQSWIGQ